MAQSTKKQITLKVENQKEIAGFRFKDFMVTVMPLSLLNRLFQAIKRNKLV